MNNDLITKSNEIIQNKTNNGTYLQNQVVAALLANRMSNFVEDEIDMKFSLTRNELLDMLKRKGRGGREYKTIGDELTRFNQTCILTWTEKTPNEETDEIDERVVSMPFFEELAYYPRTQKIEAKWNKQIIPYLRALSSCYTSYSLADYLKLNSSHAQVLYELMKSYLGQGYITYDVDVLREKLGCTKDYYKTFNRFNDKILSKDIKEINENTDISIVITKRIKGKDGKTIQSLLFEIKSKEIKKAWLPEYPTVLLTEKEYDKLFHHELNVPLVKQCMYRLHSFLTANPTKPIKDHYRKIMDYYNAWKDEPAWEQTTFSSNRNKRPKSSVRKSNVSDIEPSFDINEIQQRAMYKDNYDDII
jgi:plasmid replication initiation protein